MKLTDEDWKKKLTKEQYEVLRKKSTEPAFSGKLKKGDGFYVCAGCGAELFSTDTKYDSGCGWPSFFDSVKNNIETKVDNSHGMKRIEIICKKCGGHLGHIFDDGPDPTGKRYCVNSVSLKLKE